MGLVGSNPTLSAKSSRRAEKTWNYRLRGHLIAGSVIALAAFAALYAIVSWLCWQRLDPDFGWHLQAGRAIIAHGIPGHDLFTYTAPNFPWIDHEWLSDVLIAWVYGWGGRLAVGLMFAAIWVGAIAIAARKSWPVAAAATGGLIYVFFSRPLAFTALFVAIQLFIWYRLPARRWLLMPLFLLWANLHGGFALGLAMLAFMTVWERQWQWWWLLPACVLATFINPYGPRLYVEIWRTLSDTHLSQQVTEWGPLPISVATAAYIVLALFALLWQRTWRLTVGIMSIGLLLAGIVSARQYLPFVIVSLPLIAEAYRLGVRRLSQLRSWFAIIPPVITSVFILVLFVLQLPIRNYYPTAAVAALRQQPCAGQLFDNYDFGGYLIWQLPGVPVYIDGRMASWRDPNGARYIDRYAQVLRGGAAMRREFAHYHIGCAILYNQQQPLSRSLRAKGWQITARDSTAALWRAPGN